MSIMSKDNEEFNERFETIEAALKYIADSQAKSEWINKKNQLENDKRWEKRQLESDKRWERTQKQLDYITKLTGIAFEDIMFQDEKLREVGETLLKKNPKRV
jgi:hypothetical protein